MKLRFVVILVLSSLALLSSVAKAFALPDVIPYQASACWRVDPNDSNRYQVLISGKDKNIGDEAAGGHWVDLEGHFYGGYGLPSDCFDDLDKYVWVSGLGPGEETTVASGEVVSSFPTHCGQPIGAKVFVDPWFYGGGGDRGLVLESFSPGVGEYNNGDSGFMIGSCSSPSTPTPTPTPAPSPVITCNISGYSGNPVNVVPPVEWTTLTNNPSGGTSYSYDWGNNVCGRANPSCGTIDNGGPPPITTQSVEYGPQGFDETCAIDSKVTDISGASACCSVSITSKGAPDLTITSLTTCYRPNAGDPTQLDVYATFKEKNIGTLDAGAHSIQYGFYNNTFGCRRDHTIDIPGLAVGQEITALDNQLVDTALVDCVQGSTVFAAINSGAEGDKNWSNQNANASPNYCSGSEPTSTPTPTPTSTPTSTPTPTPTPTPIVPTITCNISGYSNPIDPNGTVGLTANPSGGTSYSYNWGNNACGRANPGCGYVNPTNGQSTTYTALDTYGTSCSVDVKVTDTSGANACCSTTVQVKTGPDLIPTNFSACLRWYSDRVDLVATGKEKNIGGDSMGDHQNRISYEADYDPGDPGPYCKDVYGAVNWAGGKYYDMAAINAGQELEFAKDDVIGSFYPSNCQVNRIGYAAEMVNDNMMPEADFSNNFTAVQPLNWCPGYVPPSSTPTPTPTAPPVVVDCNGAVTANPNAVPAGGTSAVGFDPTKITGGTGTWSISNWLPNGFSDSCGGGYIPSPNPGPTNGATWKAPDFEAPGCYISLTASDSASHGVRCGALVDVGPTPTVTPTATPAVSNICCGADDKCRLCGPVESPNLNKCSYQTGDPPPVGAYCGSGGPSLDFTCNFNSPTSCANAPGGTCNYTARGTGDYGFVYRYGVSPNIPSTVQVSHNWNTGGPWHNLASNYNDDMWNNWTSSYGNNMPKTGYIDKITVYVQPKAWTDPGNGQTYYYGGWVFGRILDDDKTTVLAEAKASAIVPNGNQVSEVTIDFGVERRLLKNDTKKYYFQLRQYVNSPAQLQWNFSRQYWLRVEDPATDIGAFPPEGPITGTGICAVSAPSCTEHYQLPNVPAYPSYLIGAEVQSAALEEQGYDCGGVPNGCKTGKWTVACSPATANVSLPGFFQSQGGDIHSDGGITDWFPANYSQDKFVSLPLVYPGVISYTTAIFGQGGDASATYNWKVSNYQYDSPTSQAPATPPPGLSTNSIICGSNGCYNYFKDLFGNRLNSTKFAGKTVDSPITGLDISGLTEAESNAAYSINNSVSLGSSTTDKLDFGGKTVAFLVNGDVNINGKIYDSVSPSGGGVSVTDLPIPANTGSGTSSDADTFGNVTGTDGLVVGKVGGSTGFVHTGLRFHLAKSQSQVPVSGATITNGKLKLYSRGFSGTIPGSITIEAEASTDCSVYSSSDTPDNRTYIRTRTPAMIWPANGWVTINATNVLKDIFSQGGWDANQARDICMRLSLPSVQDGDLISIAPVELASGVDAAKLSFDWNVAGGSSQAGGVLVVASGDIKINGDLWQGSNSISTPVVEGAYVSDGAIMTKNGGSNNQRFVGKGIFAGNGGIVMGRNLSDTMNLDYPDEMFIYDPSLLVRFSGLVGRSKRSWIEVAPGGGN